jgi:hypothetical protein
MSVPRCPHIIRISRPGAVDIRRVLVDGRLWDYDSVHKKLRRLYAKPERCSSCGRRASLDWALRPEAQAYSFDIGDYHALCGSCHARMDCGVELPCWYGQAA